MFTKLTSAFDNDSHTVVNFVSFFIFMFPVLRMSNYLIPIILDFIYLIQYIMYKMYIRIIRYYYLYMYEKNTQIFNMIG